nr:MAG TPA: Glutaredoxin-1-ACTIVE CENTER, ELECTRON TRANSPORT [Caudoviricetes sp.]
MSLESRNSHKWCVFVPIWCGKCWYSNSVNTS